MSERNNGNGNITNNQNEAPTMTNNSTATTASNNQDAAYAGGPSCWEHTGPEPKIQLTAEHCIVADVQMMDDITDTPCLIFRLEYGAVDRLQCIAYHELMSDPIDIDSLNSGDTVTLTGFLQQHCEGATPRVADLCLPALFVDSLRVEYPLPRSHRSPRKCTPPVTPANGEHELTQAPAVML